MYDFLCAEHGGLGHVFVHEAAHAVAAVQRGIAFTEVRILPHDQWISAHDGLMLGGVSIAEDAQSWVQADPVGSMEFVLAGAITERGAYGHCLEGAYIGDVALWRTGAGLTRADQLDRIEQLLGCSLTSITSVVERWAAADWPSIRRVAGRLAGVDDLSEAVVLEFRDYWFLTQDDVRSERWCCERRVKQRFLREGDTLADDEAVVVRGGELTPEVLSADAARHHDAYGTYGISVFAVRDITFDELAQQPPLVRFEHLTLMTAGVLRAAGLRLEPTGRNARHFTIVFDDLAEGVSRLCACEHQVRVNPYHEE